MRSYFRVKAFPVATTPPGNEMAAADYAHHPQLFGNHTIFPKTAPTIPPPIRMPRQASTHNKIPILRSTLSCTPPSNLLSTRRITSRLKSLSGRSIFGAHLAATRKAVVRAAVICAGLVTPMRDFSWRVCARSNLHEGIKPGFGFADAAALMAATKW